MASLTIALTACCLFLCSLATPSCLDDDMAMFQSEVKMLSSTPKDVKVDGKGVQEAMAVSAGKLSDIDQKLTELKKKCVENLVSKLKPLADSAKKSALTQLQGLLPMLKALDTLVVKADNDLAATLSWDWVDATFGSKGSSDDFLHTAATLIKDSNLLKGIAGSDSKDPKASGMINRANSLVNGVDTMLDETKWAAGNALETNIKTIADQLTEADEGVKVATKLFETTLSSWADETSVSAEVKENTLKVPEAVAQLEDDSVNMIKHVGKGFEKAFEGISITKEHRVQDTLNDVKEVADTLRETQEKVQQAAATAAKIMSNMKAHREAHTKGH